MEEDQLKTSVTGVVSRITYRNESNSYTVAQVDAGGETITVVGIFPFLTEGDVAEFFGSFIVHPSYGSQFKAESFERKTPKDAGGIFKYLASGAIKGIGPATAQRLVVKFGTDTLDIIQNDPRQLSSIKGISVRRALEISEEYNRQFGVRDILLMLSKYRVSPERCLAVFRKFGETSTEMIKRNPYLLCEEEIGLRFETVEEIAADLYVEKNSEMRLSAGLDYVMRRNLANGHTCLPRDKFIPVAARLLECSLQEAEDCCDGLLASFRLRDKTVDGVEYLALPEYYEAEEYVAARLSAVKRHINLDIAIEPLEIDHVENRLGIRFEALQRQAIHQAFTEGVLILTGGPGTGKTTTLNAIIQLFESRNLHLELAAPTGRAAKRMTELTGREAKTIHRLLEVEWGADEKQQFARNERNPLSCDVLIVDESSMIDITLFSHLLKALHLSCRILLVGDSDQLPSVGAGNVLSDLLSSGFYASICLKKVFRQAGESKIVRNAHAVINGEDADFSGKDSDCFFLKKSDRGEVCRTVLELVTERLPKAYGFHPTKDIQILCPSKMLETGSIHFNELLQEALNPPTGSKAEFHFKGFSLREGDKVMQIKNNYDLPFRKDNGEEGTGVFNGDVGWAVDLDKRGGILKVRYDDRVATYCSEDLSQLELAYAVTVHKSQGSEYDCVILPLLDIPTKLQYRNLLYTAVTRAKKLLIVVGEEEVWRRMAANDKKTLRYTLLREFLKENERFEEDLAGGNRGILS